MAKNNRAELTKVLDHYKGQPEELKYKAARYLIRYMPYHYSYAGSYKQYCDAVDSILALKLDAQQASEQIGLCSRRFLPTVTTVNDLECIDRISYIRRSDGNDILPGAEYELFYWSESHWVSLGRQTAKDVYLAYNDAPTHALFYIKCHSYGKDNRISEYEDRRIIWR